MDLFTAGKLTALRKHKHLSQEVLAEKIGVSRQSISKWERGEASPDTDNLLALGRLYGVSLDDIMGDITAHELIKRIEKSGNNAWEEASPESSTESKKAEKEEIPSEEKNDISADKKDPAVSEKADIGEAGHKEKKAKPSSGIYRKMMRFPFFILVPAVYLILGITLKLWHPGWIIFFTIPTYYITALSLKVPEKKKRLLRFPVYLYTALVYLLLGFAFSLWHPLWLIFIIIPAYYWYALTLKKK